MTVENVQLQELWSQDWSRALKLWSSYLRLREPAFLWTSEEEKKQGLTGSFAMIRFLDTQVVVSLRQVKQHHLEGFGLCILAHEIGHHIYAPGDLTEHGRMLSRMARMLPRFDSRAPEIANLYTDLMINHRLKVHHDLPLEKIYEKFAQDMSGSRLYLWYLRIYEIIWNLPKTSLAKGNLALDEEGDAILASRIIRRFSDHPVEASGRFAALALARLEADAQSQAGQSVPWMDTLGAAEGSEIPEGLIQDQADPQDSIHPSLDPLLNDLAPGDIPQDSTETESPARGQNRSPDEFVKLLRVMGMKITEEDAAMKYYKEMAAPLVIPFPKRSRPPSMELHPEGLDVWDVGQPLEKIDWLETLLRGPVVIPGITAVERMEGESPGSEKTAKPLNLDIYIDSSGSIPDPRKSFSPLCLAGAVMALSALRAGARVRAVLWSGPGEVLSTPGFTRDVKEVFKILTGYFGGSTAFPLNNLVEFYNNPQGGDRLDPGEKTHILVISDEGVDTMLEVSTTRPEPGKALAQALKKAGGGGSLVLNIGGNGWLQGPIPQALGTLGWVFYRVQSWEEMVGFSRDFSRRTWGKDI